MSEESKPVCFQVENNHGGANMLFYCPGCESHHGIIAKEGVNHMGWNSAWYWNGDLVKPTFMPSILVNGGKSCPDAPVCHSYITDGMIEFLTDCTHPMAGKTVALNSREP